MEDPLHPPGPGPAEALQDPHASDEDAGLYAHYRFKAAAGQKFLRVDKYLVNLMPNTSRNRIQLAAEHGFVQVNGRPVRTSYKVKPGDDIALMLPYPPPPELQAEPVPLDIVYEDPDLMLINKPAGMVCHPSVGHHTGTMVHGLLWHFAQLPAPPSGEPYRPGLVHRIDKDTTGLLVVAKSDLAMTLLAKQFFDRTSDRNYLAIVWGRMKDDAGTITGHIGRSRHDRTRFTVVPPEAEDGKHAVTHYAVMERFGGIATLVRCKLETGRTHQIRVHLRHIGHTLFGDAFYEGDRIPLHLPMPQGRSFKQFIENCLEIMPRQALHAKTLGFTHPRSGAWAEFDSDMPPDFVQLIEKLRRYAEASPGG